MENLKNVDVDQAIDIMGLERRNFRKGTVVTGFDNWEQLQEFIYEHGGAPVELSKRDGGEWTFVGNAFHPYTVDDYLTEHGDCYALFNGDPEVIAGTKTSWFADLLDAASDYTLTDEELITIIKHIKEPNAGHLDKFDNITNDVESEICRCTEIWEEYERSDKKTQSVIITEAAHGWHYWETIDNEFLEFYHDVHSYAIGVLLDEPAEDEPDTDTED